MIAAFTSQDTEYFGRDALFRKLTSLFGTLHLGLLAADVARVSL